MKLLEEMEGRTGVRARLVACECGDTGCETVWVFAQVRQAIARREAYWLAMGFGELEVVEPQARFLCADIDDDGARPRELVDRGVAIVGLSWRALMDLPTAVAQCDAWRTLPAEVEAVPPEIAWRARGICFGNRFTRVAAACVATTRFYEPDAPVPAEEMRR